MRLLALSLLLWAADPPKQPLRFSHAKHAGELKLSCATCHVNPSPGEMMTFPAEAKCMTCHKTVKTDSPDIQLLARFLEEKKRVPWVRVYQVPTYVFWSHRSHLEAGGTCQDCHGDVASMPEMYKAKETSMGACMTCHSQKKAPNDCSYCHEKVN